MWAILAGFGGGGGTGRKIKRGKKEKFPVLFCIFTINNFEKEFIVACAGPDVSWPATSPLANLGLPGGGGVSPS